MSYTTKDKFNIWTANLSSSYSFLYERERKLYRNKIKVSEKSIANIIGLETIDKIWMSGADGGPPEEIGQKPYALKDGEGALEAPAIFINTKEGEDYIIVNDISLLKSYKDLLIELFDAIKERMGKQKEKIGDLIEYIKNLPKVYERASLSDIAQRKGTSSKELIKLIEDLIINGKINATINKDVLIFKKMGVKSVSPPISTATSITTPNVEPEPEKEVLSDTFEASVYKKMKDTGYIDLAMIADKHGIATDKVIMVVYRMMTEFDGDIDGDKFRPLVDVKLSSIEKLTQKLKESYS